MRSFVVLLGCLCGAITGEATPPRYRFEVGERLVFERKVERKAGQRAEHWVEQVQLYVLERRSADWLVLLESARVRGTDLDPPRGLLVRVDERGVATVARDELPEWRAHGDLLDVLPALATALEGDGEWSTSADAWARVRRCRPVAAEPDEKGRAYEYSLADTSGALDILRLIETGRFCFDPGEGCVTRAQRRWSGPDESGSCAVRLHRELTESAAWVKLRLAECARYRDALRVERAVRDELLMRPDRVEQTLSRLDRIWTDFLAVVPRDEQSPVRGLARGRLAQLAEARGALRERARLAGQWLDRPAAQWSLQDFSGETIRSESVRDRFTLEFFWSAGSADAVRSFAILRELQETLPADRLRIVCLNIDEDPVAARNAAQCVGQGLLHVSSGPPIRGEAPLELPVLRLLNRESSVVRIVVGWRPDLADVLKPLVP